MPRRPNYGFERAERNRAKASKKEEKLKRQQERAATRTGAVRAAGNAPAPRVGC